MSKLHPVEVMWRCAKRMEVWENWMYMRNGAQDRSLIRLREFGSGYASVFINGRRVSISRARLNVRAYLAGRRAAERWLEGCPVRRIVEEPFHGSILQVDGHGKNGPLADYEDPDVPDGLYRLERIGD